MKIIFLIISCCTWLVSCSEDDLRGEEKKVDIIDRNGDGMPDNSAVQNKDPNVITGCNNKIDLVVRDFSESHPDFERAHLGWGPAAGIVESVLGPDRKPIFKQAKGDYQLVQDEAMKQSYTYNINYWTDWANPMFDGADSFNDWYRDSNRNMRFEKVLELKPLIGASETFYFESAEEPYGNFFPLAPQEGFGPGPVNSAVNPNSQNFLFTTEIHLTFEYIQGQIFRFSGDDDLWIFVNGKLALDLGGLHVRFNGSINFDAQAQELGITPGNTYNMDIFHAERHTEESNFRIETNIACFTSVPIV